MADRSVLASNSFETFRTTFNSTASDVGDIADLLAARMIHDDVALVPVTSDDSVSSEEVLLFWRTYLITEGYLEESNKLH